MSCPMGVGTGSSSSSSIKEEGEGTMSRASGREAGRR